ncbi:hypothetical protein C8Q75DRAFT_802303 [Abortiporus biennis]|nr:hypothetical protein C8Q75DRAFT_802303 [Abortiporus biennis]
MPYTDFPVRRQRHLSADPVSPSSDPALLNFGDESIRGTRSGWQSSFNFSGQRTPGRDLQEEYRAEHRGSVDSSATLTDYPDVYNVNYSSYRHPYDIQPPRPAHGGSRPSYIPPGDSEDHWYDQGLDTTDFEAETRVPPEERRRGLFANILQLADSGSFGIDDDGLSNIRDFDRRTHGQRPWGFRRIDSLASEDDQILDPDDPLITGERKKAVPDQEDIEKNVLRGMNYRQRRKEKSRMRVEYNVTSVLNRQNFIMRLARALMTFGAPSHRIESQLLSAARILEVDAEFIHIPGVIICSFGDQDTKTTETHFVKCGGRLSLGSLHNVHQIYRAVVHDEISARKATIRLEEILTAPPIYPTPVRLTFAFLISALICPLAFGGSFLDMWIAGLGSVSLHTIQILTAHKGQIYANVFEITVTIMISFIARALSTIHGQIFCYTAISSAGIVAILPGYLILSSSLELASKNIVCGSVKMVYALIFTLFIGFGLQIGSDLYMLFDHNARDDLTADTINADTVLSFGGNFVADNGTSLLNAFDGQPFTGTFTFTNFTPTYREHITKGCYRPPTFPWYLRIFPWWSQFIIVPLFSILSSLANLQPWKSWDLVVMVVISCVSYLSNKVADHFIFSHSDIVSSIGAFVVGLMGNMYSRKFGGTAFTSMVTGVLFLVPSGLSQAGGITAQGNGIDIGNAMIAVTIGITVGLFMSQALVYLFGSRKNAAIFSF